MVMLEKPTPLTFSQTTVPLNELLQLINMQCKDLPALNDPNARVKIVKYYDQKGTPQKIEIMGFSSKEGKLTFTGQITNNGIYNIKWYD